jgi:DNA-binding transcriptional MerR regulator
MVKVADSVLEQVEKDHGTGITSADLLLFFKEQDIRFGEATLRKWVQLGLLPRSVRVGTKGKHQGSKGMYPVRVIRQILRIKELMAKNLTIEEIQRQFLFVRGDVEALEQALEKIFGTLDRIVEERDQTAQVRAVSADLGRAQVLAKDLVERLERIERRLIQDLEASHESEAAAS